MNKSSLEDSVTSRMELSAPEKELALVKEESTGEVRRIGSRVVSLVEGMSDGDVTRLLKCKPDISLKVLNKPLRYTEDEILRAKKLKRHVENVVRSIMEDKVRRGKLDVDIPEEVDRTEFEIAERVEFKEKALKEERDAMEMLDKMQKELIQTKLAGDASSGKIR